jgi:hypothetical protein
MNGGIVKNVSLKATKDGNYMMTLYHDIGRIVVEMDRKAAWGLADRLKAELAGGVEAGCDDEVHSAFPQ